MQILKLSALVEHFIAEKKKEAQMINISITCWIFKPEAFIMTVKLMK